MRTRMTWIGIVVLTGMLLGGCATQGVNSQQHERMSVTKVNNELQVPRAQSEVWDTLVKELSKSFYVINNIDKESRIINVSFSSNSPEEYVDCGITHRTYTQGDKNETYDYETAASSQFKAATARQPMKQFAYYVVVRRETSLDGRSNIYVAPSEKDKNSTTITVNTRYVFNLKVRGDIFAQNVAGKIISVNRLPEETSTAMFNTNQPGSFRSHGPAGDEMIMCGSKGKLEAEILGMIKGQGGTDGTFLTK